jgi:hypothetical protein
MFYTVAEEEIVILHIRHAAQRRPLEIKERYGL